MTGTEVRSFPGIVIVTGLALRPALDAVLIAVRSRRLSGLPHSRIHDDLAAAFLTASTAGRTDVPEPVALQSLTPTVTVKEAAAQMNRSPRQVRRIASKLGGRIIVGRWLLDDTAIAEHLEGRRHG